MISLINTLLENVESPIAKVTILDKKEENYILNELNKKIEHVLLETLLCKQNAPLFSIPELEIIGANEIFNHLDDEFKLKYLKAETDTLTHLNIETIRQFCRDNSIDTVDKISKIKLVRYRNGNPVVEPRLKEIIEYTDDENKCVLSNGKWYMFNHDYLSYLNASIDEINVLYKKEYDFNEQIHNQFIEEKYSRLAAVNHMLFDRCPNPIQHMVAVCFQNYLHAASSCRCRQLTQSPLPCGMDVGFRILQQNQIPWLCR